MRRYVEVVLRCLFGLLLFPLDRLDFKNVLSRHSIPMICYALMPTEMAR